METSARLIHLTVSEPGLRLDKYLAKSCDLTRSQIQSLIELGRVTVDGRVEKASYKPRVGEHIRVDVPPVEPAPQLVPEDIPIRIVYEDDELLVVDKPAGITVYPAPGHPNQTLMNAILARCPEISGIEGSVRPGIVHRLDKDTSGLMVVAKTKAAQLELIGQMKRREMTKKYIVAVRGLPQPPEGIINAPIGRHPRDRKRMSITPRGREATTSYRVLRELKSCSLVEATLHTGRTHQIRVHFSHKGHPVIGDPTYGVRSPYLDRQFLHAYLLGFHLPSTGEYVEFRSELPPDLRQALEGISPTCSGEPLSGRRRRP